MKRVYILVWLFCLLFGLTACQSYRSNPISNVTLDAIKNLKTATVFSPTTTHVEEIAISLESSTPSVAPISTLFTLTTETPTGDIVRQTICSPLQYESVASLAEIISDPYNPPLPGHDERHHGVDFSYYRRGNLDTIEGVGIQSIMTGYVAAVINDRLPYGNMVIIETPVSLLSEEFISDFNIKADESLYHLYAHMQSAPLVEVDEMVECGQVLGAVGMTGYGIVNPHLHLETRIGTADVKFPGMAFYTTDATLEEMSNYQRWRTSGNFRHFDPISLFTWYLHP